MVIANTRTALDRQASCQSPKMMTMQELSLHASRGIAAQEILDFKDAAAEAQRARRLRLSSEPPLLVLMGATAQVAALLPVADGSKAAPIQMFLYRNPPDDRALGVNPRKYTVE
jgi:hypothetical protein